MRTALLTALLATAAVSIAAPPAVADDPSYECAADLYANDDLAGPGAYTAFVRGYLSHAGEPRLQIRCEIYVNGWATGIAATGTDQTGLGFAVAADLLTVPAQDTDVVEVCTQVSTSHGSLYPRCWSTTTTQLPATEIQQHLDAVEAAVAAVVDLAMGFVAPTAPVYSSRCDGGTEISNTTIEGVLVKVFLFQPAAGETDVCVRVEDVTTGRGVGGQLVVTQGNVGPGTVGLPSTDADADACTTTTNPPNTVPGSHPIADIGLAGVSLVLDAYANGSAAWVCVRSDDLAVAHRVVIPVPGGPSGPPPNVQYYPDPAA